MSLDAFTPEQIAALLVATSFAAGLNTYATVATLGLLQRFGAITLPPALEPVASWWVIGACVVLFAIEFFADKIPAFDLVWNALHTFIRVPAGALLAWAAATPLSPGQQLAAAAAGAALAFLAHAGKMAVRAAVTPSPEPLSNISLSLVEDAVAVGLTWFATTYPLVAALIVIVLVAIVIIAIRIAWRALAALFRGARRRLASS